MAEDSQGAAGAIDYRGPLYDSHAHLFSDDQERYPRTIPKLDPPKDGKPFIRPPFGPGTLGIPGGMHGSRPINEKPSAEKMAQWMAETNVVGMAAVQKGMIYWTDNSYIIDSAQAWPGRMTAVIILDPAAPETPAMMRDLNRRGAVSVRFFPVNVDDKAAWLTSPQALEVWALADELGMVVDLEAPPYDAHLLHPTVEMIADRFPKLQIVLDHIFMPVVTGPDYGIDARFDGFAARDTITYKFTSLNMDYIREAGVAPEAVLRRAVDFFGADKVMWGSDIGTSSGTYREMVDRAIAATALLTGDERRKVLHDTGRRVFTDWKE